MSYEIERNSLRSKIICSKDYYNSDGVRDLAHQAKIGIKDAYIEIARSIANEIKLPDDSILIPVPSSNGHATNNLEICNEIAKILKLEVQDCIKGIERKKLYDLKKDGFEPDLKYFDYKLIEEPKQGTIFLFDVVVDKANTMMAAKSLFNREKVYCMSHSMVDLHKERNLEIHGLEY